MKRLLLILTVFGMIARAIEPTIIKDINGQVLELTQAQRNALGQCKTLKQMLGDCGSQTIDFEGAHAPIFKDDIEQLTALMEDPKQIQAKLAQVPQHRIISLFKLADYLDAPKGVGFVLAEKVEDLIIPRITALEALRDKGQSFNDAQVAEYAELQAEWQPLQKYLGISMSKWLEKIKERERESTPMGLDVVDLGCDFKLKNKLRRLNGIEKIGDIRIGDIRRIGELILDNHNITSVDIALLRKIFPRLYKVSLKNNRVEKINETEPMRNLRINLKGNPLKSITIEHPERSNYVTFETDNPEIKINFVQDRRAKTLTWLKSLAAKSKIACEYYLPPLKTFVVPVLAGGVWGCVNLCHEDELRAELAMNPMEMVQVLDGFVMSSEPTVRACVHVLGRLCQYGIRDLVEHVYEIPLKEAFEKFQIPHQSGYMHTLLSYGWHAGKAALLYAATAVAFTGLRDAKYSDLLRYKAQRNPYRIRVNAGDTNYDFPSNYTYNLFGKF